MSRNRSGGQMMYGGMYGNNVRGYGRPPREERKISIAFGREGWQKHCSGIQALLSDGDSLFTASRDSTVKRWYVPDGMAPRLDANFIGHTDWVNDMVLVDGCLVTAAADRTVKLWNASSRGQLLMSHRIHSDYVTSLASAQGTGLVASAGLRAELFVWDLKQSPEIREKLKLFPRDDSKDKGSIYALDMSSHGNIVAAGSTDAVIRLFDVSQGRKIMKLKGHTDNVRCLLLNSEGTRLLSGSSDHTLKLWDLGQQRCIQTFHVHTDSVWSLLTTDSFNMVLSGGRDKCVYRTNLSHRTSELLFAEENPIQYMAAGDGGASVWTATSSSSVHKWPLPAKLPTDSTLWSMDSGNRAVPGRPFLVHTTSRKGSEVLKPIEPLQSTPAAIISGLPPIVHHIVLPNQRHILTKDKAGFVSLWDVTVGRMVKEYGKVDIKTKESDLFQPVSTLKWFSTDTNSGSITITLKYHECFQTEMYAVDLKVNAPEDKRLNFGDCMLRGLFRVWAMENDALMPDANMEGHDIWGRGWRDLHGKMVDAFRFWEHSGNSVWVSSENSEGEPWRLSVRDISGRLREHEEIPDWVAECVLRRSLPMLKELKCAFHLVPADESVPKLVQNRLNAPRVLQVRKVAQYLKQKLQELDPPFYAIIPPIDFNGEENDSEEYREESQDAEYLQDEGATLELTVDSKSLPFSLSIGAVQQFMGKGTEDLRIQYGILEGKRAPLPVIAPRVS